MRIEVDIDQYPRRSGDVREHAAGEDFYLDFEDEGQARVVLNPAARAVWEFADGKRSVVAIARALEQQLDLPERTLLVDVAQVTSRLLAEGVLVLRAQPLGPPRKIDWHRIAEPQLDLYDVETALALFCVRHGAHASVFSSPQGEGGEQHRICEGAVIVRHRYAQTEQGNRNASLDHPHIAQAAEILRRWPLGFRSFRALMHTFHPTVTPSFPEDENGWFRSSSCHSSEEPAYFGTMWSTVNCPYFLAENFVHEMAHQKLFALGIRKETHAGLIANGYRHRFASPIITDRPRPMSALVHGVYAYLYVTTLDLHMLAGEQEPALRDQLRSRLAMNVDRLGRGLEEISANLVCDAEGVPFFTGFGDWIERTIRVGRATLAGDAALPGEHPGETSARVSLCARESASEPRRTFRLPAWCLPQIRPVVVSATAPAPTECSLATP